MNIHSIAFTNAELSALSGFLIVKDDGNFKEEDYVVITTKTEPVEAIPATATGAGAPGIPSKLTRTQTFFTVTGVQTSETTRGIKRGFAMVKIKRTKNPLPKKVDEVEEETEETA